MNSKVVLIVVAFLLIGGVFLFVQRPVPSPLSVFPSPLPTPDSALPTPAIVPPVTRPNERVTKKPFGIYITAATSPVQPERFSGYHTGVDFETFPEEQNTDVRVMAICDGTLAVKRTASGYGGVAVQNCKIDGQAVTIIYGHVKLTSITTKVGERLKAGEPFAVLGKGFSTETDGERKHLHLGIHKGTAINILGYVQKQADLKQWLDVRRFL